MRFNKPAYPTVYFSETIWVKCPKCSGFGLVNSKSAKYIQQALTGCDSVFNCKCCGYKEDQSNKWYGYYQGFINRSCGFCGNKILSSNKPTKELYEKQIVKCGFCNKEREYEINWYHFKNERPIDPYFGMDLWLRTNIKSDLIWLYNIEHLKYLREYVEAKLRTDDKRHKYSMITNLPKFIKSAKNRNEIIKKLNKLEADFEQMIIKEYYS